MIYVKPQVVSASSALDAVQTVQSKPTPVMADVHIQGDPRQTAGAYDADE